jgi:melibiose permease/lactose/raffinose/galactose permease
MMNVARLIFPMRCSAASYLICRKKYKIDSRFYAHILSDLRERGEILKEEVRN